MSSRTLAAAGLLALLCGACFVDNPGEASSGTSGDPPATTGPTTGSASTTGVLPVTTVTAEASQTGTSGDATTTTTGDDTTGSPTTGPGPVCPATLNFPGLGGGPCRTCVENNCCDPVRACAEDPGCVGAWDCLAAEPCPGEWGKCPGHEANRPRTDAISTCMSGPCAAACSQVVCGPEKAKCTANPACEQVNDCVEAQCSGLVCPPEDPNCYLACWDSCAQMNPGGGEDWSALLICYGSQCP